MNDSMNKESISNNTSAITNKGNTSNDNSSSYNYIDKAGPRQYKYDSSMGGRMTYKQDFQSTASGAFKSDPFEPICMGRN